MGRGAAVSVPSQYHDGRLLGRCERELVGGQKSTTVGLFNIPNVLCLSKKVKTIILCIFGRLLFYGLCR